MIRRNDQPLSTGDYCSMIWRQRYRCAAFFLGVVGVSFIGLLVTPRKYQSEAKLYVKENLRIDPTATDEGQPRAFDTEREAEMQSVLALLDNRSLYEQVVEQLGPELILEADLGKSVVDSTVELLTSFLDASSDNGSLAVEEKAIRKLNKTISIDHPKKSHVVVLSYKSRSAERAQKVVQAYVSGCLKQHLQVNTNPESQTFFEKQERLLQQKVIDAKNELRDAKNAVGLISVVSQRKLLEEHITNLDREILTTETNLASSNEKIEKLRAQLPFEMQSPSATSSMSVRAIDEMRNQLFTAEMQFRQLQAMYQDVHPRVKAAKEQLEEGQVLLNQQQLLLELSTGDALASKKQALHEDFDVTKQSLVGLNEDEVRIVELERRVEELAASHRLYAKKLEQARLDQHLESDQISNLRLAQAPTRMGKPLSRGGLFVMGTAILLGLAGSVGLAHILDDGAQANGVPEAEPLPLFARLATAQPNVSTTAT